MRGSDGNPPRLLGTVSRMHRTIILRCLIALGACSLLLPVFFEVTFAPELAFPAEVQAPDPAQEAKYTDCLAQRDAQIHQQAFATIDNPDVQREFISTQRDEARVACRATYPERMQTKSVPLRFNLIDLTPRL